jgi:hypothetical protein
MEMNTARLDVRTAARSKLKKGLCVSAGTCCVGLGAVGIVVPLLPATPFLLLVATCYARGSERWYRWVITNRWFGRYIREYRENGGVPLTAKISAVTILWVTILLSAFFFVADDAVRVLLVAVAAAVTLHIVRLKTMTDTA